MPHKHRRKELDEKSFDLAPSQVAKPLPAYEKGLLGSRTDKRRLQPTLKRKRDGTANYKEDDTPKAFARLMQFSSGKRQRTGLDDGGESKKKKNKQQKSTSGGKHGDGAAGTSQTGEDAQEPLKIKPGERLADFAARVNQALPVSGLARRGKVEGVKQRQTKTEKRLHRMYADWRQEEARRKEKREELQEQQEEQDEETEAQFGGQSIHLDSTARRSRRKRMVGEVDEEDDDPWAVLKTKREAPKGIHDVVQAPPTMKVVPKEKFKVRNGAKVDVANVPSAAGSLKRREELGQTRQEIIQRYRDMMKGGGRL